VEQNHEVVQDQQRELFNELLSPQPTIIAIEGGPCAGKTTLLNELGKVAKDQDRQLVLLSEIATPLIFELTRQGTNFLEVAENPEKFIEFETLILKNIIDNINRAKLDHAGTDALIVIDRVDVKPYLQEFEYQQVLDNLGLNLPPIIELVDKVIYLPTVARREPEKYITLASTNPSRYEDAYEAVATCDRNLEVASLNPDFAIYSDQDFDIKIRRAIADILNTENQTVNQFSANGSEDILHIYENLSQISTRLNTISLHQTLRQIDGQEFVLRRGEIEGEYEFYDFFTNQDSDSQIHRSLSRDECKLLSGSEFVGRLHKYRSRYIFEFEGRDYVLSHDYYDEHQKSVIEIDGMDEIVAARVKIKGFKIGDYQAQDLVQ
jgi:thymidylate kinase